MSTVSTAKRSAAQRSEVAIKPMPSWLPTMGLWRHARSLFVLSCGRTGTDTLAHVLATSPAVWALHEPEPQLMAERKEARTRVYDEPTKFNKIFIASRAHSLVAARMRSRIYAETSARLTFFAPVIADLLPNAKFVFLHRHPGEIVRSGMRRGWYVAHQADKHRIAPVRGETGFDEWENWNPFEKVCWYWNAYHRFILDFVKELPSERWLELRSTDFFDPSTGAAEAVLRFLDVSPPEDRIRAELSVRHNAQGAGDFPHHSDWSRPQKEALLKVAGHTMGELGYELG